MRSLYNASVSVVATLALASCSFVPRDSSAAREQATTRRAPNIVVIFIDDLGYADVGCFGARDYKTPNIDRLAREGRRFDNFYVSQAVCSASRASLLTGCYANRVGILGALGPQARHGIAAEETTLAEVCKSRGYATACIGKWHLGHHRPFLPLQHGFDAYYGLPYSNDMWPEHPEIRHLSYEERVKRWPELPLIEGNEVIDAAVDADRQRSLTRAYTERAMDFMRTQREQPFFLYLAHSMVHVPLFVGRDFEGKSGAGLFGDVMTEVDWSVGRVVDTLRELGLERDTLVLFTSDNGPWLSYGDHAGSALPLREGKGTMFDGGCRVPTIAWWPGRVPANTTCATPAMTIDILPTVAELIGADAPPLTIDGRSIATLLTSNDPRPASPQQAYYYWYERQLQAMRMGKWKLHFPHAYRTLGNEPGGHDGIPAPYRQERIGLALYDLEADIGETHDVSASHEKVVADMVALAEGMRARLGDADRTGTEQRAPGRIGAGD